MKSTEKFAIVAAAMTAAVAMAAPTTASAADMEKCYGVAKAGHNDCQTASSSCAGTAKMDGQGDAFVALPEGTCEKLVGGSLEPKSS
ncbi:DUF2282 domain-containing protein [Roseospira navarrensis]|uniref:DUF2282 domain-containing protein n=1 Tax=Roseospira navarrensis TaxID=140058 RepID=A0A7X1ZG55_9PROT|nr:DUF2282 domain-containing protein [Roseospira navarrensis]MQX37713.1 DUF2282 domain-containing protein [Roseospira navarrensis]